MHATTIFAGILTIASVTANPLAWQPTPTCGTVWEDRTATTTVTQTVTSTGRCPVVSLPLSVVGVTGTLVTVPVSLLSSVLKREPEPTLVALPEEKREAEPEAAPEAEVEGHEAKGCPVTKFHTTTVTKTTKTTTSVKKSGCPLVSP